MGEGEGERISARGTAAPVHGVSTLANAHKLTLVSATRLLVVAATRRWYLWSSGLFNLLMHASLCLNDEKVALIVAII